VSDSILNPAKKQFTNDLARIRGATEASAELHPAWRAMIRFCREMGYGEIACIKIHDGLPVSAEVITRKIRWL